jgi:hypothetical protein
MMRDCMRLIPWIIGVVALLSAVVNVATANYDIALWSWIAFVGWLNAAMQVRQQ